MAFIVALIWIAGSIAVGIKRLHDLEKPGIMYLIALIPYAGLAWVLVYLGFFPGAQKRRIALVPHVAAINCLLFKWNYAGRLGGKKVDSAPKKMKLLTLAET